MGSQHQHDAQGRVIPSSDWPAGRHVPPALEFVRRFCNTTNLESGADRLSDTRDFDAWLVEWGHPMVGADDRQLGELVVVRETIRRAAIAHRDGYDDRDAIADLDAQLADVALGIAAATSEFALVPQAPAGSVTHVLGQLAIGIVVARNDGTWARLKACNQCQWLFYDNSKNRSGRWCSMSACGGRSKVRLHRARQTVRASASTGLLR